MALVLTRWPFERNAGRIMFAAVAAFGLATIVFALSGSFVVALAALAVLGASDMVSVVIRMTLVQLGTPDAMRGRVTAVNGAVHRRVESARRIPRRRHGGAGSARCRPC